MWRRSKRATEPSELRGPDAVTAGSGVSRRLRQGVGPEGLEYEQSGPLSSAFARTVIEVMPPGSKLVVTTDISGRVNDHEVSAVEAWFELDDGTMLTVTQQRLPSGADTTNPEISGLEGTIERWDNDRSAFIVRDDTSPKIRVVAPDTSTVMSVHPGPIWIWDGLPNEEEASALRRGFGLSTAALKRIAERVTELPPGI